MALAHSQPPMYPVTGGCDIFKGGGRVGSAGGSLSKTGVCDPSQVLLVTVLDADLRIHNASVPAASPLGRNARNPQQTEGLAAVSDCPVAVSSAWNAPDVPRRR